MAITYSNAVGATRRRLARKLREALPGWDFAPEDLDSNFPAYSSFYVDGCSWSGTGRKLGTKITCHVYSWDTMRDCLAGFDISTEHPRDYRSVGGPAAYEYELCARATKHKDAYRATARPRSLALRKRSKSNVRNRQLARARAK